MYLGTVQNGDQMTLSWDFPSYRDQSGTFIDYLIEISYLINGEMKLIEILVPGDENRTTISVPNTDNGQIIVAIRYNKAGSMFITDPMTVSLTDEGMTLINYCVIV